MLEREVGLDRRIVSANWGPQGSKTEVGVLVPLVAAERSLAQEYQRMFSSLGGAMEDMNSQIVEAT